MFPVPRREGPRPRLDPGYVRYAPLLRGPAALGDHLRIGVQADSFLGQAGEAHGEDAGAAPDVQEPSAAIQAKFLGKKSLKSRRIGGPAIAVVDSRPVVDRRIVSHHQLDLATAGVSWASGNVAGRVAFPPLQNPRPLPGDGRPSGSSAHPDRDASGTTARSGKKGLQIIHLNGPR
jgi:hypothetical protein